MSREKVTLFGCGGWGSRIAEKLVARGDVDLVVIDEQRAAAETLGDRLGVAWSYDPFGYVMVTGTARSTVERGSVIIATPPTERVKIVRAVLDGYGLPPKRIRVEKPLAIDPADARLVAAWCHAASTRLSVGFTLLHSAFYQYAFSWMQANDVSATLVRGVRVGARARHRAAALVDLGSHVAGIAAYLGAPCSIDTYYSDTDTIRQTTIEVDTGDSILIDEVAGVVTLPSVNNDADVLTYDALDADLAAWLRDEHTASAVIGVRATHTIWDALQRVADEVGVAA